MVGYNLIDEKWIKVRYLDGRIKRVNLHTLYRDAPLIAEIESEQFKDGFFEKYRFCVYRLLTVIIMDAYSLSEEFDEIKKEELLEAKEFDNVIFQYLEKYHDRFDLLDEKHPFMQATINMLSEKNVKSSKGNTLKLNPTAVAESGRLYGKSSEALMDIYSYYDMNEISVIYSLLYTNTCRIAGGCAGNNAFLGSQSTINILIKGDTLFESLVFNTVKTKRGEYNKPIWRWDNIDEMILSAASGKLERISELNGAFFPPLKISCVKSKNEYLNVYMENYDKIYKKFRDNFQVQWLQRVEWNTLTYENLEAKSVGTTNIDEYTPLWFDIIEHIEVEKKGKRFKRTPRVIKELPDDANVSIEYFLSKTDSNSNFQYVSVKTQDGISKKFFTDEILQEKLKVFILDYGMAVRFLRDNVSSFYNDAYGKENAKKFINNETRKALKIFENQFDKYIYYLANEEGNIYECREKFRKDMRKSAEFAFGKIFNNQKNIISFIKAVSRLNACFVDEWFSKKGEET